MGKKKKKDYELVYEVNMCANRTETVTVKATKPQLAIKQGEDKLKARGFFYASIISCKEL